MDTKGFKVAEALAIEAARYADEYCKMYNPQYVGARAAITKSHFNFLVQKFQEEFNERVKFLNLLCVQEEVNSW